MLPCCLQKQSMRRFAVRGLTWPITLIYINIFKKITCSATYVHRAIKVTCYQWLHMTNIAVSLVVQIVDDRPSINAAVGIATRVRPPYRAMVARMIPTAKWGLNSCVVREERKI